MKILVATEKPFAAAAVKGITTELEAAGNQSFCWRNIPTTSNCWMLSLTLTL
jgi:hypothetical protein